MEWLSKMEAQGNYTFFLRDNGVPFLYNTLNGLVKDSEKEYLLAESINAYRQQYRIETTEESLSPYISYHEEYEFTSPTNGKNYFSSYILSRRGNAELEIIVLYPLTSLEEQIIYQRISFVLIDFTAILLLTIFSRFFTGSLLKPIAENHRRQIEFVAAASHELRTPLAVILSCAEYYFSASANQKDGLIDSVRQEGMRMSGLINDMLTLSQSDRELFPLDRRPVELDTLLLSSYEAFYPLAKEKQISLHIELPELTLPHCLADANRISQVIAILLHNAISYTPANGNIRLSLSYRKNKFYLSVTDNGIGIADEDKKKIFDRFYRAEKARSTKEHFGLGLSIAYEIIKSHHGNIEVCDAKDGGSIFTITLPG
jgi:signal transduction histidine kinase